jgi:ATP-dependent RNA helicase DDX49/DBP8
MDMVAQGRELTDKPHIVIATPGRLAGHIYGGTSFSLDKIQFLVLDEADRLLEKSFEKDLEVIFDKLPEKRQTLIFSATLTDTINELKGITKRKLFSYEAQSNTATVSELDERFLLIPSMVKDSYLVHLIQNFIENKSVIIFTHTCRSCQVLAFLLRKLEMKCVSLHSLMPQKQRLSSLA